MYKSRHKDRCRPRPDELLQRASGAVLFRPVRHEENHLPVVQPAAHTVFLTKPATSAGPYATSRLFDIEASTIDNESLENHISASHRFIRAPLKSRGQHAGATGRRVGYSHGASRVSPGGRCA